MGRKKPRFPPEKGSPPSGDNAAVNVLNSIASAIYAEKQGSP
jgi:hypothetical protein